MGRGEKIRSHPLWVHFTVFAITTVLPLALLAGALLVRSANSERALLEGSLVQVANSLANDIDRELDRDFTVLRTLARLPSLTSQDWSAFYEQAKSAVEGKGYVILIDTSLRQLVNTRVPYGSAPALTRDPQTAHLILHSKQPAVSNLFFSLIDKVPVFNVNIPILRDGEVQFILIYGHQADDLLPILIGQHLTAEWVTTIVDRNRILLARSRSHQQYVGKPDSGIEVDMSDVAGVRATSGLEGVPFLRALARSKISGWTVAAEVPTAVAEAPLRRNLQLWGTLAIVALSLTTLFAWRLAHAMTRTLTIVANAANAVGGDQPIAPLRSWLTEANSIVDAQQRAQVELIKRAEHQKLLVSELSHRVKNILAVIQAMVTRSLTDQRSVPEARQVLLERIQALARSHDALLRTEWKGAPCKEIVCGALAPFTARVAMEGPDITLDAKMVQTIGLLLHELATNAAKHGSLSNRDGVVAVHWQIKGEGPQARLFFRWEEINGPPVTAPLNKGFGSTLLAGAFSSDSGIKARMTYALSGFVYEIDAPLDRVVQAPGSSGKAAPVHGGQA